ncbi:asialoglycoprotein receptor 1-like [Hippoglossus hippoglossus]|uniref:asialoglycoprotein receptor 1-like n=1 Tax=Hippoglossus hippoglossus TaxID=8267 RepID=UPI00148B9555|nr:asialoglycoprotein receptor 1-like [Hippoglossus hippoglossus]
MYGHSDQGSNKHTHTHTTHTHTPYHWYKQETNRSIVTTFTSKLENSQSWSEPEEEMSQDSTDGVWRSNRQGFGQGAFTKGGGSVSPPYRLVALSLGLLNALLLIAAVFIGIYCAKAKDLQAPYSAAMPFIVELNYLRSNHSEMIRAKLESQAALVRERANQMHLVLQAKQQKIVVDVQQRHVETLETEKTNLKTNRTTLEENCGRCPQRWILLKSSCYYISERESTSKKNWPESRADCMRRGSDLVVINNLEEQILLNENLPHPRTSSFIWWQNSFWMGLTDVVANGTWVWVNNVTDVETKCWKDGQPNYIGDQRGNCGASYQSMETRKTWLNGNCKVHLLNWICEMEQK